MKRIIFLFLICFSISSLSSEERDYDFIGKHLIVSYMDCLPEAIRAEDLLQEKMKEAAEASGVTVLSSSHHHFEPEGLTQVLLLSESHASIHTYPEYNACFVDLFTCGDSFDMEQFDAVLTEYLQPKKVAHKLFLRQAQIEEISFIPQKVKVI